VRSTTGGETPEELLDLHRSIGERLPRRAVLVSLGDEAAIFAAENREVLSEWFLLPAVPADVPRRVSNKQLLVEICEEVGIPTARTVFPTTYDEVVAFAEQATFPVVAKNYQPFRRMVAPVVRGTTIIPTADQLCREAEGWALADGVLLQEYLPHESCEDWVFHGYFGTGGTPVATMSGRKIRSWPPLTGSTAFGAARANPELVELASRLCASIGFAGITDMCWRHDRRDGLLKLLDFNPRIGANFRMSQNTDGLDVARAMHLDLTGRPVPRAPQDFQRQLRVEHYDRLARPAYRERGLGDEDVAPGVTETAWSSRDDPVPAAVFKLRTALGPVKNRVLGGPREALARLRRSQPDPSD
jgi:predicted ATP-grasp superfamily ATP-dependent carboligase